MELLSAGGSGGRGISAAAGANELGRKAIDAGELVDDSRVSADLHQIRGNVGVDCFVPFKNGQMNWRMGR